MNKGGSNILANYFKKTTKNSQDYIPSSIKQENIRESIPIQFPETVDNIYTMDFLPNILFEEWPQDEEIKSFDFTNNGQKYNDPNSNLIIFPYSLRKETYSSMVWLRPKEYMSQKNLIKLIKEKYKNRNYNYIKNKIDLAQNNLLNFEVHNNDDPNKNDNVYENKDSISDNDNENKLPENIQESIFSSLENMKTNIKRRNSINIANIEGQNSYFGKEFYNSKLNEEEKQILIENNNIINEFYIVPYEKNNINQQIEKQPIKQQNNHKSNKNHKNTKKNKTIEIIQIIYDKLNPSNLNLGIPLCDYCRWVSSQYQILLDNNINTENNENHFLRKIYPQDKNGVPIYNPSGLYWVKLFHMGKYRKIVIDDKFPVHKETFENFLPQCTSPYELWPLILTKAIIKLYSYKYKCESYERDEVGDCSILYSLTRYIGIKLPYNKFIKYLTNLQEIKNKQLLNSNKKNKNNNNEEEKVDIIILNGKNNNHYGYNLIIGYISSGPYSEEKLPPKKELKKNFYSNEDLNIKLNNNNIDPFPFIEKNKNNIFYTDKTYKIKDLNINIKSRRSINILKKPFISTPSDDEKLLNKLKKYTVISTKKELDPSNKFQKYFDEHRFLTTESIYKSYQKYIIKKTNKIHKSGIICDVGYTLLEIFQCGNFNMKRLKPIYFGDMKLDIKVKYKQMSPEEKSVYLEQIKELRKNQKKEKDNRINKYIHTGENILFLKFTNKSLFNDNKKLYQIDTLYDLKEIEAAKFCIKNNFHFLPDNYFESSFIPKLIKDEETGEINFWTKNFYHKLLKKYFKLKIDEKKLILEEERKLESLKKEESKKNRGIYYPFNDENLDDEILNEDFLLNEFEQKSIGFNEDLNKIIENSIPGTWVRFESFIEYFNNFILFKSMDDFKNLLTIDNVWYNYDKDIYEEKEDSRIIYLTKIDNNNSVLNSEYSSDLEENELYIIFEPNNEKNKKSVSSELPYEINEETKKGNKFNDINFSINIIIYEVDTYNKKVSEIKSYSMNNYFSILNINLSKISEKNEYFIYIIGGLCPFGYHLQLLSNIYKIQNYSYTQFLIEFKNFIEKKINIIHPILPKSQFYLIKAIILEYKNINNKKEDKIVKFMTNFEGYDDNVLKNNIDVVLINPITKKKLKIYYKKIFEIDFNSCPKYTIELSIISPGNIPERNFEYILLYNNPNINIEILENIYPFYIRQKYIPNKHHIIFNELIFLSDLITTTLDVSLEYRPNDEDNNKEISNNYTDENLPKRVSFPSPIRMNFYLMFGDKLIYKKDFETHLLIRNLILESKPIIQKDKDNNDSNEFDLETYSIKCVLDKEQSPSWLMRPCEYKGDVYWKISVFSTDALTFIKNSIKEDKEKAVIENWEIKEPGRKNKAEISRKKYLVKLKFSKGEILTPREEELISIKINNKEVIESNSNMLVTNIPLKRALSEPDMKIDEKKQDEIDILKKLPKIKKYRAFFMKNFYLYSKQNRVITKNQGGIRFNKRNEKMLPNINKCCKTPEQKETELKDIEEKLNKYNEAMKKENEKKENIKENYFTMIQEMNDKYIKKRKKLVTVSNEKTRINLLKIIKENNNLISNIKEIQNFYDDIIYEDEINDEILFNWYNNYKKINNEVNNKIMKLSNKYKIMFEEIKKILSDRIKRRIEIVLKLEINEKPHLMQKYKNIINEKIILFDLNKETRTLLVKYK